jgi:hypothetical protein
MALLPEELHNYGLSGLSAMADLLTEIEARAADYFLPVGFLETLDELRGDIEQEIVMVMADIEQRELSWLPQATPEVEVCQLPR